MKCDACGFFDCGNDCRCKCHPHGVPEEKYKPESSGRFNELRNKYETSKKEQESLDGISSLFS